MNDVPHLVEQAQQAVDEASSLAELDQVRVRYLGRKGELTAQLKQLGKLPADQRPQAGERMSKQTNLVASGSGASGTGLSCVFYGPSQRC